MRTEAIRESEIPDTYIKEYEGKNFKRKEGFSAPLYCRKLSLLHDITAEAYYVIAQMEQPNGEIIFLYVDELFQFFEEAKE